MANTNEWQTTSNPLLLEDIVYKLFKYLPLKDIIIQRGVCKLWQEIGLERLEKNINLIKISFDPENSIGKFLGMAKGFSFKFTNFALSFRNDGSNDDAYLQTNRLFEKYGTHMKVLTLDLTETTNSWTYLSDILVNKAPNVEQMFLTTYQRGLQAPSLFPGQEKPKLKLKNLILVWLIVADEQMHAQALLRDIFASSPCLESFRVLIGSAEWIRLYSYVLQMFADNGSISNLKKLSLNVESNDVFEILTTSFESAPIEEIFLKIHQMDLSMVAYIETFFGYNKDTLKNLTILCPCVEFFEKVTFPTMKNLKTLSIFCWWCLNESKHEHRNPFRVFDFGELFPNLLTLLFYDQTSSQEIQFFNFDEMFPEKSTPVLTLKNLNLPAISSAAVLRRLGRIFPNVLKLKIASQTPAVLRELWTTWPEIKTLHILLLPHSSYRSTNLDSVFTGVDGSNHLKNFPSITHLRKLKHLRISGNSHPSGSANVKDIRIKDGTVLSALAEMKELVSLQISGDRHEISPLFLHYLIVELDLLKAETKADDRALHLVKYEWQKLSCCPTVLDYK